MKHPWPLDLPSPVDRAAERRALVNPAHCQAILVRDGCVLVESGRLVELDPPDHPPAMVSVYLGRDGERDLVAIVAAPDAAAPGGPGGPATRALEDKSAGIGRRLVPLRDFLATLWDRGADGHRDHDLAATAVAVSAWHASHPRCAGCGGVTEPGMGGWTRHCGRCRRDHYPRTDPAVIVAVTDAADRLLLAHAATWSPLRYSHLAGFVEPGETLEQAVHREVREESGLALDDLEYLGSQPWPFPGSVMVAFRARAVDPQQLAVDGMEITHARFIARDELAPLVAAGEMVLAPKGSVARRMIEEWYGGPVPEPASTGGSSPA